MTDELLSCPFCGCDMEVDSDQDYHRLVGAHPMRCVLYGIEIATLATDVHLIAITEEWNTRHQHPPCVSDAELMRLCDEIDQIDTLDVTDVNLLLIIHKASDALRELLTRGDAKPVCYGIFASDGEMFLGENCISDHPIELGGWIDDLGQSSPDRDWKIKPMYLNPAPQPERSRGDADSLEQPYADRIVPSYASNTTTQPERSEQVQDDLPGGLALSLAVQKGEWPHTMDAAIWTNNFIKAAEKDRRIATDFGVMVGWFANAIMAGYDTAVSLIKPTTPSKEQASVGNVFVVKHYVGDEHPTIKYNGGSIQIVGDREDAEDFLSAVLASPTPVSAPSLPEGWPDDATIEQLTQESGWDHRRRHYMTTQDWDMWCARMRLFARKLIAARPLPAPKEHES